jgi:hypothetical protein
VDYSIQPEIFNPDEKCDDVFLKRIKAGYGSILFPYLAGKFKL